MDICLINNHLSYFSFISMTSESETNDELYPKLKLTNILYSQQYHCIYLFLYLFEKITY